MSKTLKATFATRREAEMAVERLVQEYGVERTDIFIVAAGDDNTAGDQAAGADVDPADQTLDSTANPSLHGAIRVSVDIADEAVAEQVRTAFQEFAAASVSEA